MALKKLTREILAHRSYKKLATVSFTKHGRVIISGPAVRALTVNIDDKRIASVDIFQGDIPSDFFISRGTSYGLRRNGEDGAIFNSIDLCSLVIAKTWEISSHQFNEPCPKKITFLVANKPVDDDENINIFALIRKKI